MSAPATKGSQYCQPDLTDVCCGVHLRMPSVGVLAIAVPDPWDLPVLLTMLTVAAVSLYVKFCRIGVYPVVSAEHVAKGGSAKAWVDSVTAKAGRGKGEWGVKLSCFCAAGAVITAQCVRSHLYR